MLPCNISSSSPSSTTNGFIRIIEVPSKDNCSPTEKINVSLISPESNEEIYSMWLGGELHSDTTMFTQATCLFPLVPPIAMPDPKEEFKKLFNSIFAKCKDEGMEKAAASVHALKQAQAEMNTPSRPKLVGIKIYAGDYFVNGLECVYSHTNTDDNLRKKEKSYGNQDEPRESFLSLASAGSKIVKICIRYGRC